MSEADNIKRSLSSDSINALVLGSQVYMSPLMAGNRPFVFSKDQARFLMQLQKLKQVHAAAISVGKDEEWGNAFLKCKKFVTFRNLKLEEARAKNGVTIDYLMQYANWTMEGKKTIYEAKCETCQLTEEWSVAQAESCRDDQMNFIANCEVCFRPLLLKYIEEKFEPTREQNEMWKEAASRIWPKVERIHHQFSSEEFIFESDGESNGGAI